MKAFTASFLLRGGALTSLALTGGCVVGPTYRPPAPVVAMKSWSALPASPMAESVVATNNSDPWWTTLNDQTLSRLVERALVASPDILIAAQRVREARAALRSVAGGGYPQVGVGAAKMEYRRTGPLNTINRGSYPTFQIGFDASWEVDLWGGTRRAVESTGAALDATEEEGRGVEVALAAEVARAYVELRTTQQRLGLARTNLELQQRTLALTRERIRAGLASELDEYRGTSLVANTEAVLPQLEDMVGHLVHLLALLVGEEPNALAGELAAPGAIPSPAPSVALGLPAELVRQRPDIRAAERRLASSTARIGAARAQLYPHLSLVGTLGVVSSQGSDLFEYANRYFSIGPGVRWSVFDAGRIRAQVEAEEARTDRAYAEYRKVVLAALAEVENSIGALNAEQRRHAALVIATDAARKSVATSTELYREGVTDFLSVIDTERSLAAAEDNLAQSDRALCTNLIALHKSLGGGWPRPVVAPGVAQVTTVLSNSSSL